MGLIYSYQEKIPKKYEFTYKKSTKPAVICRVTKYNKVNVNVLQMLESNVQGLARIIHLHKKKTGKWPINQVTTY